MRSVLANGGILPDRVTPRYGCQRVRSEALIAAIAEALTKVSPQECENYLANQGYRRQL
jgi:hypothetical protein